MKTTVFRYKWATVSIVVDGTTRFSLLLRATIWCPLLLTSWCRTFCIDNSLLAIRPHLLCPFYPCVLIPSLSWTVVLQVLTQQLSQRSNLLLQLCWCQNRCHLQWWKNGPWGSRHPTLHKHRCHWGALFNDCNRSNISTDSNNNHVPYRNSKNPDPERPGLRPVFTGEKADNQNQRCFHS